MPIIKSASSASDEAAIVDVLVRANLADPASRWLWPGPQQFHMHFPSFVKAFGGRAFAHKSAYYVDGYSGAALWLPPNVNPDEDSLITLVKRTVYDQIQKDFFSVFEQMGRYHPSEPHWYLPLMGVDPSQQGKGVGSALLQHTLMQLDHDNKLAYLESSNPRNIPLYKRHGFEILGTIQIGSSPPITPMLRRPK
ncbi:MAG TPA: GNAT family N-acetyltransferase [Nitrososphaera sp.]